MNRRAVFTIAIALLLFFLFFNPFSRRGRNEKLPRPYLSKDALTEAVAAVKATHRSPEDYVIDEFRRFDIIFLGEYSQIRQQVDVVRRLIPLLHAKGISLGVELALQEDQGMIDAVLRADAYDEEAVRTILFNRMVVWGFQEYADLFQEAWKVNQTLSEGQEPFRIVGLEVRRRWELLQTDRDMRNPEIVARIFEKGIPDAYMAETIRGEFISRGKKALVYTGIQHAFTRFVVKDYAENAQKMGLSETRRMGQIVYEAAPGRVGTVLMHSPWPYKRSQILLAYPVEGFFDRLMEDLPEEHRRAGFSTRDPLFGGLDARYNDYAAGHKGTTLADMCDGYIIVGPINEYEVVRPIPGFVDANNLDTAIRDFPGATIDQANAVEMNEYIAGILDSKKKLLERF